jgi:hypothetical protein
VVDHGDALRSIPLPEGRTLYDAAEAFVTSGESLAALLSQRADRLNDAERGAARALRVQSIRMLTALRTGLEVAAESGAPDTADVIGHLFGFLDQRIALRLRPAPTTPTATTAPTGGEPAPSA